LGKRKAEIKAEVTARQSLALPGWEKQKLGKQNAEIGVGAGQKLKGWKAEIGERPRDNRPRDNGEVCPQMDADGRREKEEKRLKR
jgi:hypothetical protein